MEIYNSLWTYRRGGWTVFMSVLCNGDRYACWFSFYNSTITGLHITIFFAWVFLKEKLKTKQIIGFLVAATGLFVIGIASGGTNGGVAKIPIKVLY